MVDSWQVLAVMELLAAEGIRGWIDADMHVLAHHFGCPLPAPYDRP